MPSNGIIRKKLLLKPTLPKGFIQAAVFIEIHPSQTLKETSFSVYRHSENILGHNVSGGEL